MIKVYKSINIPSSLKTTSAYDGEDVKQQLLADQHDKCYICERRRDTDIEIEHHKSQKNYPDLIQDWDNLFMGCGYCNRKKSNAFDNTLNPSVCYIEDEIEQRIDFVNKKVIFKSKSDDVQHCETVALLDKIFNGTKHVRNLKEEKFIEQVLSVINRFQDLVCTYLKNPSIETTKAVKDELAIDKQMLGFKYWIIRDTPILYRDFSSYIIWNK
jgi:uncharacterized protein (TIGR02646 family)